MKDYGYEIPRNNISSEVWNLFTPREGFNAVYYGRVRNGKTYAATADIIDLLERGEIVYANWNVDFQGFDERYSKRHLFWKILTGKKMFFAYSHNNFHSFHPDDLENPQAEVNMKTLGRLVGVHVFIDEGQWVFNSQVRVQDPEKRKLVLHGGHYCRNLNIITQRPSNIFKDMRSQVQFWYKCEKRLTWPVILFERTTYEDMKEDMPDEESKPSGHKVYVADSRIFKAYNTHAMRASDAIDTLSDFRLFRLGFLDKIKYYFTPKLYEKGLQVLKEQKGAIEAAYAADGASSPEDVEHAVKGHFEALKKKPNAMLDMIIPGSSVNGATPT